jgi:pilus assembly protein CpaE
MTQDGAVRTLVVSSDPDVLESMKRALASSQFHLVGEAWPGIEAVRSATQMTPELVMLHVEEPLGPALNTIKSIGHACPNAGIAVVSSLKDLGTVRRIMNAGSHDFATFPLTDDELRDAAQRAVDAITGRENGAGDSGRGGATGTVLTVAGPRGGVGKTSVATNLAVSLARETGTAVALVDLDLLFGSAAIALGIMPAATIQEWVQLRAAGHNDPVGRYLSDHRSGLKVLAAPLEPDPELEVGPQEVAAVLSDLSSTHEFVVVDTGASFTEITAAAIELASMTMLLTTGDVASLRAVRHVVQTLRSWGMDDERLRLIRNSPVPFKGASEDEIREAVGLSVEWVLPHDPDVFKATDIGVSVVESRPRSPFARQLREIALYVGRVRRSPERKKKLGVF